ncbi:MAG: ribonuclease P protein component [Pseudomonadales bacterium]|nr:ribonuclease P protein component [Pseudomonadales bacterium]
MPLDQQDSAGRRFTKAQRLLKAADYGAVFKAADFKVSAPALLILAARTQQTQARIGLVVSKKNAGCAVSRNRIKRLLRETFRQRAAALAALDMVFMARPGLSNLDNPAIIALANTLLDELTRKAARAVTRATAGAHGGSPRQLTPQESTPCSGTPQAPQP